MAEPWKLRSLTLEGFVGYKRLEWPSIDPDFNLLLGQNGVGKSLLLEVLLASLKFLQGQHARDTVIRDLQDVAVSIARVGDASETRFTTNESHGLQGQRATRWRCKTFHLVENRQPKNVIGRTGSVSDDNAIMRYAAVLAKLQTLLRSRADADDGQAAGTARERASATRGVSGDNDTVDIHVGAGGNLQRMPPRTRAIHEDAVRMVAKPPLRAPHLACGLQDCLLEPARPRHVLAYATRPLAALVREDEDVAIEDHEEITHLLAVTVATPRPLVSEEVRIGPHSQKRMLRELVEVPLASRDTGCALW